MPKVNLKDFTLKIKDNGSNEITVKIGDGNLTWTETKNREYLLNRGLLDDVIDGDQVPVDVKFDFTWLNIKASTGATPTVEDVLKKRGEAAAWVSSDSDSCRPYAVKLLFTHTPACGSAQKEDILFSTFRYESLEHDSKAGSISCAGKSNEIEPAVTRYT